MNEVSDRDRYSSGRDLSIEQLASELAAATSNCTEGRRQRIIAAAIRAAVLEEREACAAVADNVAGLQKIAADTRHNGGDLHMANVALGGAIAALECRDKIRARSKEQDDGG